MSTGCYPWPLHVVGRLEDTFLAFIASLGPCFIMKLNIPCELPYLGELIIGSV